MTGNGLPKGWRAAELGEICEIVNGSTPKRTKEYWGGSICWITPTDLGQLCGPYIERSARTITKAGYDSCSTKMVPAGAVLMSSRAPIGHLGIATIRLCMNQGCKAFVPNEAVETKYLYYALRHALDDIRALGSGVTFKEVGKGKLAQFAIPLPPLDQQRRIATRLDRSVAALERARTVVQAQLEAISALAEATLRQAFEP